MRKLLLIVIGLFYFGLGHAQIGGNSGYNFLKAESSARVTSLGGNLITVKDDDLSLSFYNPALLNQSMEGLVSFSYVDYLADVKSGLLSYSKNFDSVGLFAAHFQFMGYGKFNHTDEAGNILGEFNAGDYNMTFGYSREIDSLFSIGANVKMIYSDYFTYKSFGMAVDIAGHYYFPNKDFSVTAVIKNMGYQLFTYDNNRDPLPFEVQLGISKRLKDAPLRFSVIGTNLQKWDLNTSANDQPVEIDPFTGEEIEQKGNGFGDKLMRHVVLNAEILASKNFHLGIGYNYLRRKELMLESRPGLVGFSFGVGMKISKFRINYGRSNFSKASGLNSFTVTVNPSEFTKKSKNFNK